ncbi:hypothetical protein BX666DRAFT_1991216 [Dichotomocladium elegans]|nr:hypothetical protein BX666DRAFT_1991216 [Dichotomocladium elegans]
MAFNFRTLCLLPWSRIGVTLGGLQVAGALRTGHGVEVLVNQINPERTALEHFKPTLAADGLMVADHLCDVTLPKAYHPCFLVPCILGSSGVLNSCIPSLYGSQRGLDNTDLAFGHYRARSEFGKNVHGRGCIELERKGNITDKFIQLFMRFLSTFNMIMCNTGKS